MSPTAPYPVNLDIQKKPCLVVGGGEVGTRKVLTLVDHAAEVTVVSPAVSSTIDRLSSGGVIRLFRRPYESGDLEGQCLVFAAADDPAVNRRVAEDSRRMKRFCNVADRPDLCDFTVPAAVIRGDLIIAVSTSGKSPALSRIIRKDIEKIFGPEYADALKILGALRERLLAEGHDPDGHRRIFRRIIENGLIPMLREGRTGDLDHLLSDTVGRGCSVASLMEAASC